MHSSATPLKPLSSIQLSADESKILKWLRLASWEAQPAVNGVVSYKAKVPEFYAGARLYRMQAGGASAGSLGALELFIKKLEHQGIITKQGLYPLEGHGSARSLSLTKVNMDNLGIGQEEEED